MEPSVCAKMDTGSISRGCMSQKVNALDGILRPMDRTPLFAAPLGFPVAAAAISQDGQR
jgi:hypothetical protein